MSKSLLLFQKEEYSTFRTNLISVWAIDNKKRLTEWEADLKPIHKRYLSLACASTIASQRITHSEFVYSIIESSNLSMILTLKGLQNPSCVLLRQSIELSLKHIFFLTHPTEYSWTTKRIDYRDLSFQHLLEYLDRTDEHRFFVKKNINITKHINESYQVLSRYVHAHSKGFMGYKSLSEEDGSKKLKDLNKYTRDLWPFLIVLLVAFSPKSFIRSSALEQSLMRSGLTMDQKAALHLFFQSHTF